MKIAHMKAVAVLVLFAITLPMYGQEENGDKKLNMDIGTDLVSTFVWRGMYQAGASIQPTLSLSAFGFTLGAWGSTDLPIRYKEIDFYLSYEIIGFSATLSDYWWNGEGASYFKEPGSHHLEASLSYSFSEKFPLTLGVNTLISGSDDKDDNDKRFYSTYISASFPFSVKSVACELGLGFTPRAGMYQDGNKCNFVDFKARATKNLQLSCSFTLPVFAEIIFSPARDNAFFVLGLQF